MSFFMSKTPVDGARTKEKARVPAVRADAGGATEKLLNFVDYSNASAERRRMARAGISRQAADDLVERGDAIGHAARQRLAGAEHAALAEFVLDLGLRDLAAEATALMKSAPASLTRACRKAAPHPTAARTDAPRFSSATARSGSWSLDAGIDPPALAIVDWCITMAPIEPTSADGDITISEACEAIQ
jgi:hypothetical protein